MTKIQKIEKQITELRQKQSATYVQASEQAHKVLIDRFFKPQGVYFNMGHNEVRVRPELGNTRYNTKSENPDFIPFDLIFNNNNWNAVKFRNVADYHSRRDGEFELGVEFNVHSRYGNGDMISTGDNLKQLAFFGLVAELVENEKLALVSTMIDTFSTFESVYNRLQDQIHELEMHIRVIKEEEAENEKKNLIKELEKGKAFETRSGSHNSYNTFDYGYKKTLYGVKNIKIVKVSGSGKTANIEVKVEDWRGGDITHTLNKVNMEKIVSFAADYQS